MADDLELYRHEDAVKQLLIEQVRNLSHVELKKFNKSEYKKKAMKELCKLLPKFEKSKLDETSQCISNALQSAVNEQVRKRSRECTPSRSIENLLSNTVIDDFNTTLQIDDTDSNLNTHNESELSDLNHESNDDENDETANVNDSITQMKQVINSKNDTAECSNVKTLANDNTKVKAVCDESCQIKPDTKKRYDMTRCVQCSIWFHDTCVGIEKGEPIGLWMCKACRDIPQIVKDEVMNLKNDVKQLMESTDTILEAVSGISSQLEKCVSGLQDQINALSKQIKSRDKTLSESIDTLTSVTNKMKTSVEEKSNRLLNKRNTIIEKVKSQTEIIETAMDKSEILPQTTKKQLNVTPSPESTNTANKHYNDVTNTDNTTKTKRPKYRNVNANSQNNNKSDQKTSNTHSDNPNGQDDIDIIDLTTDSKRKINQSTLIVGSSI